MSGSIRLLNQQPKAASDGTKGITASNVRLVRSSPIASVDRDVAVLRLIVFVIGSFVIIWVSRRSLCRPRSHGFPRLFAFEAILALIIINSPHWFVSPLSTTQLVSWLFLALSILLVVWGFALLRRLGEFVLPSGESPIDEWESTRILVTNGIYRYIRHPMYSSLLFLAWGAFLKSVTTSTFVLTCLATLALYVTAKFEEAENLARFGDEYRQYMRQTRLFVPFFM